MNGRSLVNSLSSVRFELGRSLIAANLFSPLSELPEASLSEAAKTKFT